MANRLQAALWREAYYLVGEGVVSVEDVDIAISAVPGCAGRCSARSRPSTCPAVAADWSTWQAEAISMAVHKSNVYIDLSGWSPKYFPAELVRAAGGMLSGQVLFGSDYPLITPERWLDDFASLDLRAEVLPGILKGNACKVLGLA